MRRLLWVLLAGLILAGGCNGVAENHSFLTDRRRSKGLVVILPGIEGVSELNRSVRRGLISAGVDKAMPIVSWGRPIGPAGMLVNQVDFVGNKLAGARVARMIVDYQDQYPGRPVYIIGHSGGGGVAVFAAEAMPPGRMIDGLVLLSASIGNRYNLDKALSHCRKGVVNFYNRGDVGLLGVGTTVLSNVDGSKGPSAGLTGFKRLPKGPQARKVFQVELDASITGSSDAHSSSTNVGFIARHVSPWLMSPRWPASGRSSAHYAYQP
jgi:pimeloyl-ACP methyl ester carboxylesterase